MELHQFLNAAGVDLDLNNYKVHLATGNPLNAFFRGNFKEWQEYQTRRNFPCKHIVSLIELRKNKWLFVGVYKVIGHKKIREKYIAYETELLPNQSELIGRVIVHHKRMGRASYLKGLRHTKDFLLSEVLPKKLTIADFPGHNNVRITYEQLKLITSQVVPTWHGALSNISGVYLITDTSNGLLYVGSATGDTGIWQRWCSYASNGHGGNQDLKKILRQKGNEHKNNFQYSILEIADTHSTDKQIRKRETYWKEVLCSKLYGYNGN